MIVKLLLPAADPDVAPTEPFREAQALMRLDHPNIARLVEAQLDAAPPYVVTECVKGETLARFLGELHLAEYRLTISQAARIIVQIGEACMHAHHQGVVHRDLKPQNVLVSDAERHLGIKVVDFGVARLLAPRDQHQETTVGRVYGTIYYMAPEQIRGVARTTKVDAFALAAISFELLTGYRCFVRDGGRPMRAFVRSVPAEGNGAFDAARRIIREPRLLPRTLRPDLPAHLEAVILRGLECDPSVRLDVEGFIEPFRSLINAADDHNTCAWPVVSEPPRVGGS